MSGASVDRITAVVCMVIGLYFTWEAWEFPAGGGDFPIFCAFGSFVLAILIFGETLLKTNKRRAIQASFPVTWGQWKPMALLALAVTYIPMMFVLGYFTATFLFFVLAALLLGIRNFKTIGLTAVILIPVMYGFFVGFLQAQLPTEFFLS